MANGAGISGAELVMIQLRMFEEKDYLTICEWWSAQGWPLPPIESLSEFGMIAYNEKHLLCVGWLYLTTGYWGWIEWIVVNPDAPRKLRQTGLKSLIARLLEEAKVFNIKAVHCSLKSPGLIRMHQRAGFLIADKGMTNMILTFNGGTP